MNGQMTFETLLKLLRKNIHILIGWLIGSLAVTALFTFYIITPQYESTSRIVVNQTENRLRNITEADISTNISLMITYQNIIMEPIILEDVIEQTDSTDSLREMRRNISFQNEEESLVFGITAQDEDPMMAANLANATAEIFQSKIGDILPVESVTILSQAVPDYQQASPNIIQNLFLGPIMGLFLGFGQIFLTALLDKRIKDDDIITDLGWVHLGSVNEMTRREIKESVFPVPKANKEIKNKPRAGLLLEEAGYVRQKKENKTKQPS